MNCTEWAEMKLYTNKSGLSYGLVELKKLPDIKNLFVKLDGKRIYPCSYTELGYPLFSLEVFERYSWLIKSRKKDEDGMYKVLHVEYSTAVNFPKEEYVNTKKEIALSLKDVENLKKLLQARKFYSTAYGNYVLDEFVIFGRYKISSSGDVVELLVGSYDTKRLGAVCYAHDFYDYMKMRYNIDLLESRNVIMPEKNDMCPWCTKFFNIDYVKNGVLDEINGKVAHNECAEEYRNIRKNK